MRAKARAWVALNCARDNDQPLPHTQKKNPFLHFQAAWLEADLLSGYVLGPMLCARSPPARTTQIKVYRYRGLQEDPCSPHTRKALSLPLWAEARCQKPAWGPSRAEKQVSRDAGLCRDKVAPTPETSGLGREASEPNACLLEGRKERPFSKRRAVLQPACNLWTRRHRSPQAALAQLKSARSPATQKPTAAVSRCGYSSSLTASNPQQLGKPAQLRDRIPFPAVLLPPKGCDETQHPKPPQAGPTGSSGCSKRRSFFSLSSTLG